MMEQGLRLLLYSEISRNRLQTLNIRDEELRTFWIFLDSCESSRF